MNRNFLLTCLLLTSSVYTFAQKTGSESHQTGNESLQTVKQGFLNPPNRAKPGVYWYFMDGNMNSASITKDLESMKKAGIGNLIFLEVNVGIPVGPVGFLSPQWQELFKHAVRESERLGIEITLGIGPGWTGSGGPWVPVAQSMQHLVSSTLSITDADKGPIKLPLPMPVKPFFGEGAFSPGMKEQWKAWYKDVAVLAFPTPAPGKKIDDILEKALYYRAPYSSAPGTKQFLPTLVSYPDQPKAGTIDKNKIIDLSTRLQPDGTLDWTTPTGNWTIMRFVSRNTGSTTRPAPVTGLGFESDKFDTVALDAHLAYYIGKVLAKVGEPDPRQAGGLKRLHMDSWEMGSQNWTGRFRQEFLKRRGYDPLPFYPVYAGNMVESDEISERFLWDLRQTSQELVLEYHAAQVKKYAHQHGLSLSIEPYDMNPSADLELGSVADLVMSEFWSRDYGFHAAFSCIEATSVAHIMGQAIVPSEAFTSQNNEGWKQNPGSMKNQGDWAFAMGLNRFVFHTFQNQQLPDSLRPGMTMGPYGVHWDRNQTWWPMVGGYHQYVSRSQFVLQQGKAVADILYLTPEGSPHVFRPPSSALKGDTVIPDRRGYNFDGCAPGQLYTARVENGNIIFPSGASYKILVLPAVKTMTPALLEKISSLVEAGATVIGSPPVKSPGLSGYPVVDDKVSALSTRLWGQLTSPQKQTTARYGKGKLIWGGNLDREINDLYPEYELTAAILKDMGQPEDFTTDKAIRYTHRMTADWDIYFVSNTTGEKTSATTVFRSSKGAPVLWDAMTGKQRMLPAYTAEKGLTTIPLTFEPDQSYFIVFSKGGAGTAGAGTAGAAGAAGAGTAGAGTAGAGTAGAAGAGTLGAAKAALSAASKPMKNQTGTLTAVFSGNKNFPSLSVISTLKGPWKVSFDTKMGGPASIVFDALKDWTLRPEDGVRYYSGIAVYHKVFNLPGNKKTRGKLYLDLGNIKNMARVKLNGKELGIIWTAPYSVEMSSAVKAMGNVLEIEVANLWPNRLIGDERLPDDGIANDQWPEWLLKGEHRPSKRYTFATYHFYNKDTPLLSSGLIGPVTIRKEGN